MEVKTSSPTVPFNMLLLIYKYKIKCVVTRIQAMLELLVQGYKRCSSCWELISFSSSHLFFCLFYLYQQVYEKLIETHPLVGLDPQGSL